MTFEEWIEKRLFNIRAELDKNINITKQRADDALARSCNSFRDLNNDHLTLMGKRFYPCEKTRLLEDYPNTISKIEELITKKQQLEAERDKANDLNKELLLADIEQVNDQLAEARKEYLKCKSARDELMEEFNKEVGA